VTSQAASCFELPGEAPIQLWGGNQALLTLVQDPVLDVRTTQNDVHHHDVRERMGQNEKFSGYVCTTEHMIADAVLSPACEFWVCGLASLDVS
jgi:hypothetical protein